MKTNTTLQPGRFAAAQAAGLRVFPVLPGDKKPAIAWSEFRSREPTEDEIQAWDVGDFNIGVICGEASGVAVLDVDDANAQAFVDELALPLTPCVSTSRGMHYYFKLPPGGVRNATGIMGLKLDLRGDGGYVVGAGSVHESGSKYEWVVEPSSIPLADFPDQILSLLGGDRRPSAAPHEDDCALKLPGEGRFDWWLKRRLAEAIAGIRGAGEGSRNKSLFSFGVAMAKHVAGAGADWAPVASELARASRATELGASEVDRTLESCWSTGSAEPTAWMMIAREWLHLGKPDVFYHIESGQHLKVAAFNNAFAKLRLPKPMTFARWLLQGGFVGQVHDLDYQPVNPERFVERDGLAFYNTYVSPKVQARDGDWSPFVTFVSNLVPDEIERAHLFKMMAWTVRRPGEKLRHALLLRSEAQGVGKTMLTEIWTQLLGERNVRKTTTEEVASQFQGFIKETLLVILEELNWGVGPTGYNRMKDLITGDIAVVNEKFMPVRHWPNLATLVILTNLKTPLILEDKDRRFFYIDSPATRQPSAYYAEFASWWGENIGIIRAFLDTIDLDGFQPHAPPPMTAAKEALIADGREDLVKDLAELIAERAGVFDRDLVTLEEVERELGNSMRGKTKSQLKNALARVGAEPLGQHRVEGKWTYGFFNKESARVSLWAVRNVSFWSVADPHERATEYGCAEGHLAAWHGLPLGVRHMKEWQGDPRMGEVQRPGRMKIVEALELMAKFSSR